MSGKKPYPKRDSHFAHRFTRILQKSCASQDIGRDSVLLLIFIVHTEDAARYSGSVRFWNSQLMETMAFRSPKQLNDARNKAMEYGWLEYSRAANKAVGHYHVLIPKQFSDLDDTAIEPTNEGTYRSTGGTINGTTNGTPQPVIIPPAEQETEQIAERISDGSRNELVTDCGKHSNPYPNPIPKEKCDVPSPASPSKEKPSARNSYPEEFESFWSAYPSRAGRKLGKSKAFALWQDIPKADRPQALVAAKNYSAALTRPPVAGDFIPPARDAERFLRAAWWRDWIEFTPVSAQQSQPASAYKSLKPIGQG